MNARKKAVKVRGAVLIMILAVMTVLIILVAGSIAVVYSAHNRTELKFRENQAYYTGRSLVEEFVDSMMEDTATSTTYKEVYYEKNPTTGVMEKKEINLDLAGAIEMDLYKIPVSTETDPTKPDYNEWYAKQVEGMSAADKAAFEASVNFIQADAADYSSYADFYKQYTSKRWSSSSYANHEDTIEYSVDGSYLADYGSDGTTVYGSVYNGDSGVIPPIKVQILERRFDMGEGASIGEKIRNGDRRKDHFVIKVSAEISTGPDGLGSMPVTTSLIIGSSYNPPPSNNNAIVAMGSVEPNSSLRGVGGVSSLYPNWTKLTNNSKTAGNVFFKGSLIVDSTNPPLYLKDDELLFVKDVLRLSGKFMFDSNPTMKSATIYAGITEFDSGGKVELGSWNTSVNLITQRLQFANGYQHTIYGNVFADELVLTCGTMTTGGNSNGPDMSQAGAENLFQGEVYCNYLSIPESKVNINFDDPSGKAYIQLDNYGGTYLNNQQSFYDCFNKKATICKGIKIITDSVPSAVDESYGKQIDAQGTTYSLVKGHKYDATYKSGGTPEENECLNFGDVITHNGNNYTVDLDPGCPSQYKKGSAPMELRYEIPKAEYDAAKAAYTSSPSPTNKAKLEALSLQTDFTRKIELPEKLFNHLNNTSPQGKDFINLPTERSIFGDYFFDYVGKGGPNTANLNGYHADIDYDGNIVKEWQDTVGFHNGNTEHKSPAGDNWDGYTWTHNGEFDLDITTPPVKFDNDNDRLAYIKSRIIPAEIILGDSFTYSLAKYSTDAPTGTSDGSAVNGYTIPAGASVITGNGILPSNHSGIYYIDARSTSVELQIGKGDGVATGYSIKGEFVVVGDNQVSIFVPGDGVANEKINMGGTDTGYAQWTLPLKTATDIRVMGATPETPYPNVTYYVANNIEEIALYEGGGVSTVICGTLFSPYSYANFDTSMNANNANRRTYYGETGNVGDISQIKSYVYGNVICARFKAGQHAGITFIPNTDPPPHGTKKITFQGVGASR